MNAATYGMMAEFKSATALVAAVRTVRAAGYRQVDAFAPFAVEGLVDALALPPSPVPFAMFGGGIVGAGAGLGMQYYANIHVYVMNVGGRSINAWPAFVPATFELIILLAVLGGLIALLVTLRFPALYHPVFNHSDFRRASRDGFFLCIEATDKLFEPAGTSAFLRTLAPVSVRRIGL